MDCNTASYFSVEGNRFSRQLACDLSQAGKLMSDINAKHHIVITYYT